MTDEDLYSKLRKKCWDNALDAYGYSYIFDMRAARYSNWIYWLNVTAVIVPVLVGLTAIGYGYNTQILKYCINAAIPLTIGQFVFSLFAMFGKWDEKLAYSYESSQSHNFLYIGFKKLAEFPLKNIQDFTHEFNLLEVEANGRSKQDVKYNVTDSERRKGMRYGLREFQRPCAGCNNVPLSMKSTNCDVCGNF
jgi:mobilome CxxCx(11)CxxC protein